ncbi:hypothetical protein [Actinomadura sp. GTD37]|uniref:hypothetical protein n=1 Tax=Actinomadura sp. GTD37 TaxID=1778030 RepID=UPI0035C157FC
MDGQDAPPASDGPAQQYIANLQTVIKDLTGWKVWASDGGNGGLYATRGASLTGVEIDAGLARTVDADDPHDLVAKIQEELRKSAKLAAAPHPAGF